MPVIALGGIVNAASGLGAISPGALASLYGANLSDAIYSSTEPSGAALFQGGVFVAKTVSGTSVNVGGWAAPLLYVSPTQINFQVPWEALLAPAEINVIVSRGSNTSLVESVTLTATSASVFLNAEDGVALTTCYPSGTKIAPGSTVCALYGNGFGPKNQISLDGTPSNPGTLDAATARGPCSLTIGGRDASVMYCGAAPFLIIDQLNFVYPANVPPSRDPVEAVLTVDGLSGMFLVPSSEP